MNNSRGRFAFYLSLTVLAATMVLSSSVAEPATVWQAEWEKTVEAARRGMAHTVALSSS